MFGWLSCVFLATVGQADVSLPFDQFQTLWSDPQLIGEPPWNEVVMRPDGYRNRLLGFRVRVEGAYTSADETRLSTRTVDGDPLPVICRGGCELGLPGQWLAVIGWIPKEGAVDGLIAYAATRIVDPVTLTGGPDAAGANGAAATTDSGLPPQALSNETGNTIGTPFDGQAPALPTAPAAPTAPATGGTQPLDPGAFAQREAPQVPVAAQADQVAVAVLERFIASRNPRLPAGDRRYIAVQVIRTAIAYGMRWEFFASLIAAESNFNRGAVSPSGAMGLGQLMPGTARDLGVSNAFDVDQNLRGAATYIKRQLDRWAHLDAQRQFQYALAAYNAGPGRVVQYGGVPPFRETHTYIRRIAGYYTQLHAQHNAARAQGN